MARKPLDYEELNENVKRVQYAVRGELYLRASELQKEGKKIIFTNVGNPHALGQKPLTFPRQVRKKGEIVHISASHRIRIPVHPRLGFNSTKPWRVCVVCVCVDARALA